MTISGIRGSGEVLITTAADKDPSGRKHKIEWFIRMLFNKERVQQTWKLLPKPTTNKNSRTYSYSIKRDNCITFIGKFSNGPWGLDSQACPTFAVLPRLCCWQLRYALEQGSVNYSPQANSSPWIFFFVNKFLLEHNHAYLFMYRLSLLLHPSGRAEELPQTLSPTEPETLTIWPRTEKVYWFLV